MLSFQIDSRVEHVGERHEGEVHQADPEEGLEVREQVRQVAGEGRQICICQPTEVKIIFVLHFSFLSCK